jgi:hypothetical protein
MLSSGHRPIAHLDPVQAAEEEIRRYLAERHILTPAKSKPKTRPRPARDHTWLCLLSIYAAIALVVGLGAFWLNRMECDPMFSDRGLKAVCRNRAGNLDRIANLASVAPFSFRLPDVPQ